MSISSGTLVAGRYRIVRKLGEGGFGAVYLAEDTRLGNKRVAVKENFDNSREAQKQFRLEARLLATLEHTCLPRVTDNFIESNGRQLLVMDFVEGDDLHERVIQSDRPMAEQEAASLMMQVCEAVAYLHEQSQPIIHRDIKPPNIKITRDRRAVLVDFGIAKIYHPKKGTVRVAKAYSQYFSPPEQHGGRTDTRSDVYALGATLYFLVCADVPPDSVEDRLAKNVALVPPSRRNRQISPALERIVMQAMELDPNRRYHNAREMANALKALVSGQPYQAAPPQAATGPKCPACGRINRPSARFCAFDRTPLTPAAQAALPAATPVVTPAAAPMAAMPPQVRFEIANAYARNDNYAQAIAEYRACLQQGFTEQAVYHNLGLCYRLANQPREAIHVLSRGVSAHPHDADLQFQLARAYWDIDQPANALPYAERACQLNSQDAVNHGLCGGVLVDLKRYPDAIRHLEQAVRGEPNSEVFQFSLGRAYWFNDQIDKAINTLKRTVQLKPDHAAAHLFLGICHHRQKKYTDALRDLHEAVRFDPSLGLGHYFIGEALLQQDKYNEALPSFAVAASLMPDDPDPYTQMAACYALTNRVPLAINEVHKALAIDPNNQAALNLLSKLK